ncbi:MAG: glycosyltransferase family 9 protein [Acidiferrobacteraceae bacterium]
MPSIRDMSPQRVLVVRQDNIGDVVLLTPALQCLRSAYPEAALTLLASPAGAVVTPLLPWVDDVWAEPALWQDASPSPCFQPLAEMDFVARLRERRFDMAFIFTSFSQSPYGAAHACYLAGIPVRAGQARDFGGALLSHWVRPGPDELHQAERNLHLLRALGFSPAGSRLALDVPRVAETTARSVLRAAGVDFHAPYIGLAPGASCAARRYEGARFREAVMRLTQKTGLPVVVLGSARERDLADAIATGCPGTVVLAGQIDFAVAAAVVRRSRLMIVNDSGLMHVADAFQRPQVVLFSGTDLESQWQPRSARVALLRRPTRCAPCYRFDCNRGMECLDLPPDAIVDAGLRLLAASERRKARRVA